MVLVILSRYPPTAPNMVVERANKIPPSTMRCNMANAPISAAIPGSPNAYSKALRIPIAVKITPIAKNSAIEIFNRRSV